MQITTHSRSCAWRWGAVHAFGARMQWHWHAAAVQRRPCGLKKWVSFSALQNSALRALLRGRLASATPCTASTSHVCRRGEAHQLRVKRAAEYCMRRQSCSRHSHACPHCLVPTIMPMPTHFLGGLDPVRQALPLTLNRWPPGKAVKCKPATAPTYAPGCSQPCGAVTRS